MGESSFLTLFDTFFFQKMIMKRLWKKSLSHPCQSSSFLASPNFSTILMKIPIPCGKVFWHVAVLKLLPIWSWMLVSGVSKQIMISLKHLCEYKIVLKNNAHFCCLKCLVVLILSCYGFKSFKLIIVWKWYILLKSEVFNWCLHSER